MVWKLNLQTTIKLFKKVNKYAIQTAGSADHEWVPVIAPSHGEKSAQSLIQYLVPGTVPSSSSWPLLCSEPIDKLPLLVAPSGAWNMQKCTTIYGFPKRVHIAYSVGRERDWDFNEVHSNRMQTSVNPFHIRLEIPASSPLASIGFVWNPTPTGEWSWYIRAGERGAHREREPPHDGMHKSNNETIIIQWN